MIKSSKEIDGWFNYEDLYSSYCQDLNNDSIFVEVGIWKGKSICFLGELLKQCNKTPKVFAVDTFKGTPNDEIQQKEIQNLGGSTLSLFKSYLKDLSLENLIIPLELDSIEASKKFQDNSIDIIFIDGDHSYEAVRKDLQAWFHKMKNNSIMSGHDFWHEPLRKAVEDFFISKHLNPTAVSDTSWTVKINK